MLNFCPYCGSKIIRQDVKFCMACGKSLAEFMDTASEKISDAPETPQAEPAPKVNTKKSQHEKIFNFAQDKRHFT